MNEARISSGRPAYPGPTLGTRIALAWTAIVCSSSLLAGGLGLFEMQARSAARTHVLPTASAASDALASASSWTSRRPGDALRS